nr:MAG TPA: hypothetical protein [Caudoviricetes sp.]
MRNVGRIPGLEGISHEVGDPLVRRQVFGRVKGRQLLFHLRSPRFAPSRWRGGCLSPVTTCRRRTAG